MKKLFVLLVLFFICRGDCFESNQDFKQVVIWGHKLYSHTHSYIHNGFYRAFQHLGYPTYWFDDQDDVEQFDFSNSLFLTEGQVDKKIPILQNCFYLVHNPSSRQYESLPSNHVLLFQTFTKDVLIRPNCKKLDTCIYFDGKCVYIPWATDLLPDEIDEIKKRVSLNQSQKQVFWIGTVGAGIHGNIEQLLPFVQACEENGIRFIQRGGAGIQENQRLIEANDTSPTSIGEHQRLIESSYIAPAIVGGWQLENGYIPCRIFKNISYGKMGVTNSEIVYELFEKKIVYNPDTHQLFYDAKERMSTLTNEELFELMDFVKEKHTYLNRIQLLLWGLEQLQ